MINTNSKKTIKYLWTIAILFVFTGCLKNSNESSVNQKNGFLSVEQAKEWFSTKVKEHQNKVTPSINTTLPVSLTKRLDVRMKNIEAKLKWSDAKVIKKGNLSFILVFIPEIANLFKDDIDASRACIFYLNTSGKMEMVLMEIISKKDTSLNNQEEDIAIAAFHNMHDHLIEDVPKVNANVFFYKDDYSRFKNYKITEGKWLPTADCSRWGNTETQSTGLPKTQSCELWGLFLDHYENGVLAYCELLYTYNVCTDENGTVTTEDYGDGSGSTGGQGVINQTSGESLEEETSYQDEDYTSDNMGPTKIDYAGYFTVQTIEGEVVNVLITPIVARPAYEQYTDQYGRWTGRSLSCYSHYNSYTLTSPYNGYVNWSCSVLGFWTWPGSSHTKTWPHTQTKVF